MNDQSKKVKTKSSYTSKINYQRVKFFKTPDQSYKSVD